MGSCSVSTDLSRRRKNSRRHSDAPLPRWSTVRLVSRGVAVSNVAIPDTPRPDSPNLGRRPLGGRFQEGHECRHVLRAVLVRRARGEYRELGVSSQRRHADSPVGDAVPQEVSLKMRWDDSAGGRGSVRGMTSGSRRTSPHLVQNDQPELGVIHRRGPGPSRPRMLVEVAPEHVGVRFSFLGVMRGGVLGPAGDVAAARDRPGVRAHR